MTDFDRSNLIPRSFSGLTPVYPAPAAPAPAPAPHGLEAFRDRWVRFIDIAPASVEIYASATRQFVQWLQANGIKYPRREDILTYRRYLEKTKKPTTVQLYITAVRQFFLWLEAEDVCKNVAQHVKGPKIERLHKRDYLTAAQIKNVLDKIEKQSELGRRDYAMLLLMVTCGLRRIEICRANIKDIRTVGGGSRIYIQGKGQTERNDYVMLPPPVEQAIREYLSVRYNYGTPTPIAPLFTSTSNNNCCGRLSPRCITGIVKNRLKYAGYNSDRLCAHSLRHTAVTLALLAGQPLQEVQMFARHTSIVTTMIYAHKVDKESNTCAHAVAGAIL